LAAAFSKQFNVLIADLNEVFDSISGG